MCPIVDSGGQAGLTAKFYTLFNNNMIFLLKMKFLWSILMKETDSSKTSRNITSIDISKLKPFFKHVFDVRNDERMQELSESIRSNGVIEPIIVRPIKDKEFDYEIIAGHRRTRGTQLAGLKYIPCDIRDIDDMAATLIMIDSNLQQRESILPSEKARAYKYKLEAIKSQGRRTDLTLCQLGTKLNSGNLIAENSEDSRRNIYRFVQLTHLIPQMLKKVDEKKLAFIPAVQLSYLKTEEQEWLYDILSREENFGVPMAQAQKMKGISQNGKLTYEKIDRIIISKNHEPPKAIKLSYNVVKDFFPPDTTPKEYEVTIQKALEEWFQNHHEKNRPEEQMLQR